MTEVRRRRKNLILTLVTIAVFLIVGGAAIIAAWGMSNSWWTQTDPTPSADQQLPDGQSRFDGAGVDFFTRQGTATLHLLGDTVATDLGLAADGDTEIAPIAPVALEVVGDDGAINFGGLSGFTLTTANDRVESVSVVPSASGSWMTITSDLRTRASSWGWSETDVANLEAELNDASRAEPAEAHTAAMPRIEVSGMQVDATVTIAADSGVVGLVYDLSR